MRGYVYDQEEYALMELEMPWMSTTVLREGDVRVDASKVTAVHRYYAPI
jgi:hypothetical protein